MCGPFHDRSSRTTASSSVSMSLSSAGRSRNDRLPIFLDQCHTRRNYKEVTKRTMPYTSSSRNRVLGTLKVNEGAEGRDAERAKPASARERRAARGGGRSTSPYLRNYRAIYKTNLAKLQEYTMGPSCISYLLFNFWRVLSSSTQFSCFKRKD